MKRLLVLFILLVFSLNISFAQTQKHEINVGVGMLSSNQLIDALSGIIITSLPFDIKMDNSRSPGAWYAGYRYSITEKIGIGGVFTFDHNAYDAIRYDINVGKFNNNYYTISVEGDFRYINNPKFKLYSLIGVGGTLLHQKYKGDQLYADKENSNIFFNFQITPVGLKYGNRFGGFLELGFGYKGIVTAGLFFRP